jgi:chromosome segregation ATPase
VQSTADAAKPLAEKEGELQRDAERMTKDLQALEQAANDLKKQQEGQPSEPSEPKEGGGKCSDCAGQAAKSMGKAQKQLGDNKPESSLKDQDQAIESLERTLAELDEMAEEARRELLKLPFEELAKKQEKTQHATDTLSRDMENAEQEGENGGEPTPGRKSVQQAVPKQRAAAGQLKEYKPAKQKQQDAKDDLDAAKSELDEALAQLRQQLSDEVLRALEERFTAMLQQQRELSTDTKTIDATRKNVLTASGDLPAALQDRITIIAAGEEELGVEASDALKLLEEDGTTAVFPPMVEQLRDDLYAVAARCRKSDTGAPVQRGQHDVEDVLELLINALRREIERREGGGQCAGGGEPPLVPISAELKVLRYLQERVNRATKENDGKTSDVKASEDGLAESGMLSAKQRHVRDLMRRLAVKLGKENHSGEDLR